MKKQILTIVYLLLVLGTFSNSYSQNSDKKKVMELFKKTKNFYDSNLIFQVDMNYNLYQNFTTNQIHQNTKGLFVKNKKENYSKIGDVEIVNLISYNIKIDHESKLMQVNTKTDFENKIVDLESYMNFFSKFSTTSNDNYWICEMTTPAFTQVPYSKIKIYLNKTDYSIYKQELFFLITQKFKVKGKTIEDYPKLEIVFSNFKTKDIAVENIFSYQRYITLKNKDIFPSKDYKEFQIVD